MRVILCLIRGMTHFARDTLALAEKYRGEGVVGIDIAGDEASCADTSGIEGEMIIAEATVLPPVHPTLYSYSATSL